MTILQTLAPIILLALLGAVLARIQFLGREFIADLNKLAFWVALPALLFHAAAKCPPPKLDAWVVLAILLAATFAICAAAFLLSRLARFPSAARGTLAQSAFRGNLAYIGIPVLAFSLGDPLADSEILARAVFVMTLLMSVYNILAVLVLKGPAGGGVLTSIVTNPLLVAGLAGLAWGATGWPIPLIAERCLVPLGAAAVPISLLCIGGSLVVNRTKSRFPEVATAVALKNLALPALVWGLCLATGLGDTDTRIALVLAACPTAAAAYVMAARMGGDEALAGASIAASTLCAAPVLAAALWLTGA